MAVHFRDTDGLRAVGLGEPEIMKSIAFVYDTLDAIDEALVGRGTERIAEIVELANLSSMIGNIFRTGLVIATEGMLISNGPHKHPDLLHRDDPRKNVEIKVALESNQPKGHLAKPGWHLTCHYVLCDTDSTYRYGTEHRGHTARMWMIRFGYLEEDHFNLSNTAGDSGKTAVVNASGMDALQPVYFAPDLCGIRMSKRSRKAKGLFDMFGLVYEPRE